MCGIWASLGFSPTRDVIEKVAHRGPDGEGWEDHETPNGPLVLAHKRLAVIDTSINGNQPMATADGNYRIVFNGIIYNYIELREELRSLGYSFVGNSDTEVFLTAFAAWGEEAFTRSNGMFAAVILDTRKKRLFAVRDRYGIKPIYIYQTGNCIAFASEIKQFTALETFTTLLNSRAAKNFLIYSLSDNDNETFFKDATAVPPGHVISIELDRNLSDQKLAPKAWYELPKFRESTTDMAYATEMFRDHFERAVRLRLRSDVPIGFCLSGGLDSSAIVSVADHIHEAGGPPLLTVSARYPGEVCDESNFIDIVNSQATTRPAHVMPTADDLSSLWDVATYHQDMPIASSSVIAQWNVFQAARNSGVKVMLDGQGADEQMAGYQTALAPFLSGLFLRGQWATFAHELHAIHRRHDLNNDGKLASLAASIAPNSVHKMARYIRRNSHPNWLRKNFARGWAPPYDSFHDLESLLRAQFTSISLPMLLHFEDRNSMAHGIESRLPFLDWQLVEFLLGLGDSMKIADGETKKILRQSLRDLLPAEISNRQDKIGFATPQAAWLRGSARDTMIEGIDDARQLFPDIFSTDILATAKDDDRFFENPAAFRIASFGKWGRIFNVRTGASC